MSSSAEVGATTTPSRGQQLDSIMRDMDEASVAWVAAGYPFDGAEWVAREAVFGRLRAWNAGDAVVPMAKGDWLREAGERAEATLRSMPAEHLGPAGRLLLGIKDETCPTCHGRGTVRIDPRVQPNAATTKETDRG